MSAEAPLPISVRPEAPAVTQPEVRVLDGPGALNSLLRLEQSGLFGTFEYDLQAAALSCSVDMVRRHGLLPTGALTFAEIWERILPGDRERVRHAARTGAATGQFSAVYRVQPPGEPVRWMQAWAHLQRTPDGAPSKWTGIVLDASASVIAETLQHEAREQVIQLVESIAESFIALDREFRFTYVNQRVCDKTGKSREELIGQNLWDLFPEAAASAFFDGYQRVAKERVRHSFLVPYTQPDGSHAWFEAHAFPTAEGIAALIRDITELKTAREALEASEERFRRAQQAANIGAFEWNLINNQITWAAKVPTFTDAPDTDDFSGYLRYVDEADRSAIFSTIARILAGGQHFVEVRIHPPDGRLLWFYFRAEAVFDASGKPVRVYGVAMDITDRKQAEEALRNSEKIAATGKLAATIAHEINNPLAGVTNLLYLATQNTQHGSAAHQYLTQAEQELQRVAAIVRQTLGFYRGSSTPTQLNLADLLRETLALFENRLAARNIALDLDIDLASSIAITAIEGEIRQILTNLIANAMDAVDSGGAIRITLRREPGKTGAPSGSLLSDNHARLAIHDNGRGMSPDVLEHLFEPFFTTKAGAGTGLGLWVSRELAHKNNGTIDCTSPGAGQGSTFTLTLPLSS